MSNTPTLGWKIDVENDPMHLVVYDVKDHSTVMKIFLGEAMEIAGRMPVMNHIREIENSKWIASWHNDNSFKMRNLEFQRNKADKSKRTIEVIHSGSGRTLKTYPDVDCSKQSLNDTISSFMRFIGAW